VGTGISVGEPACRADSAKSADSIGAAGGGLSESTGTGTESSSSKPTATVGEGISVGTGMSVGEVGSSANADDIA